MSRFIVEGGGRLNGTLTVHGAKNSVLPILAACLMVDDVSVIHNCPDLSDVHTSMKIMRNLGAHVRKDGNQLHADCRALDQVDIPDTLMREMRSSIVFLGAIAARMGQARISTPGGCELGPRPIDLHLWALRKLGLVIEEEHGFLNCRVEGRLQGAEIPLTLSSVGATENILLAAATAKGRTTIINAAREPEISDLADFLNGCGARIHGAGEGVITIDGVDGLYATHHQIIPDRIVAATYMAAAAVTGGNLMLKGIIPAHLGPMIPVFEEAGCEITVKEHMLNIVAPTRLRGVRHVRTAPYPGFPTDAQPPIMAMTTVADGMSMFVENIFESRYKHVSELARLGAKIKVEGRVAVVEGVSDLSGASVMASDLRGAGALLVAGLCANGITEISGLKHLDRGYDKIDEALRSVGAKVKRIEENEAEGHSG